MTYHVLHYRGDVTAADKAQPGALLGHDEFHRPFEVVDVELIAAPTFEGCLDCDLPLPHTHVHLQYASPETLRAHLRNLPGVFAGGAR